VKLSKRLKIGSLATVSPRGYRVGSLAKKKEMEKQSKISNMHIRTGSFV
jgi:hypothetical protein